MFVIKVTTLLLASVPQLMLRCLNTTAQGSFRRKVKRLLTRTWPLHSKLPWVLLLSIILREHCQITSSFSEMELVMEWEGWFLRRRSLSSERWSKRSTTRQPTSHTWLWLWWTRESIRDSSSKMPKATPVIHPQDALLITNLLRMKVLTSSMTSTWFHRTLLKDVFFPPISMLPTMILNWARKWLNSSPLICATIILIGLVLSRFLLHACMPTRLLSCSCT